MARATKNSISGGLLGSEPQMTAYDVIASTLLKDAASSSAIPTLDPASCTDLAADPQRTNVVEARAQAEIAGGPRHLTPRQATS
jgi:hypothetical protein